MWTNACSHCWTCKKGMTLPVTKTIAPVCQIHIPSLVTEHLQEKSMGKCEMVTISTRFVISETSVDKVWYVMWPNQRSFYRTPAQFRCGIVNVWTCVWRVTALACGECVRSVSASCQQKITGKVFSTFAQLWIAVWVGVNNCLITRCLAFSWLRPRGKKCFLKQRVCIEANLLEYFQCRTG